MKTLWSLKSQRHSQQVGRAAHQFSPRIASVSDVLQLCTVQMEIHQAQFPGWQLTFFLLLLASFPYLLLVTRPGDSILNANYTSQVQIYHMWKREPCVKQIRSICIKILDIYTLFISLVYLFIDRRQLVATQPNHLAEPQPNQLSQLAIHISAAVNWSEIRNYLRYCHFMRQIPRKN